jgi:hypothetical protein
MRKYQITNAARAVRKHSSTIALLLLLSFVTYAARVYNKGGLNQEEQMWFLVIVGIVLLALAAADMRSGSATLIYATFKRAEDPVGYWTAVAVSGCAGLAAVGFGLGQIVGLWTP